MKGLYWLILGLCVWFIPSIVFQIIVTTENPGKSAEEVVSDIPSIFVIILFAIALPMILKGVLNIRKERKISNKEHHNKKKKK